MMGVGEGEQDDLNALQLTVETNKDALTHATKSGLLPLDCLAQNELATEKAMRMLLEM
jgi:hypothetical protein